MQGIPEKETLEDIAELFKGFADATRVHILSLLAVRSCASQTSQTRCL